MNSLNFAEIQKLVLIDKDKLSTAKKWLFQDR